MLKNRVQEMLKRLERDLNQFIKASLEHWEEVRAVYVKYRSQGKNSQDISYEDQEQIANLEIFSAQLWSLFLRTLNEFKKEDWTPDEAKNLVGNLVPPSGIYALICKAQDYVLHPHDSNEIEENLYELIRDLWEKTGIPPRPATPPLTILC